MNSFSWVSQCRLNTPIILCCNCLSHAGEDSSPAVLSLFAIWASHFSMQVMTRSFQSTDGELDWQQGSRGVSSTEKDVSVRSTQAMQAALNQQLNEEGSKKQPLLTIKRERKKALSLLLALFPFALNTTSDLRWKEGLDSWSLNVKYSYRTPSITCAA